MEIRICFPVSLNGQSYKGDIIRAIAKLGTRTVPQTVAMALNIL